LACDIHKPSTGDEVTKALILLGFGLALPTGFEPVFQP
jgi:hypothetical protein